MNLFIYFIFLFIPGTNRILVYLMNVDLQDVMLSELANGSVNNGMRDARLFDPCRAVMIQFSAVTLYDRL